MRQDIEIAEAVIQSDNEKLKKLSNELINYYPTFLFTTENIKGMLSTINLEQKRILTACSSGDHIFNMLLSGAKNIDAYDMNVFSKYFFYLKEAAIRTLNYHEFLDFFFPNNCFFFMWDKSKIFSNDVFFKIEKNIRNDEVREFWRYLFSKYDGRKIYDSQLFEKSYSKSTYMLCNNYLENELNYKNLQERLEDYHYQFYHLNIFKLDSLKVLLNKEYDFIYLSNILDSLKIKDKLQYVLRVKEIVVSLKELLVQDGMIGVCYLYGYLDDYWYDESVNGKLKSAIIRQKYFNDDYWCNSFNGMANLKGGRVKDKDALMLTLKK